MGHQADRGFRSLDPSTLKDSQYPDAQAQELSFARPSVWKRPTQQEFFSARANRMAEIRPTQANVSLVNTMSFWAMPAIAPLNPHPQPEFSAGTTIESTKIVLTSYGTIRRCP